MFSRSWSAACPPSVKSVSGTSPETFHIAPLNEGSSCFRTPTENHVWMQLIWKEESGPQLQLYNLLFGVGGIVAPFICEPFLSSRYVHVDSLQSVRYPSSIDVGNSFLANLCETDNIIDCSDRIIPSSNDLLALNITSDLYKAGTQDFNTTLPSSTAATVQSFEGARTPSRIHLAYAIFGGIFILNGLSFAFSYRLDKTDPKPDKNPAASADDLPKKSKYIIIVLLAIYMLLGVADEITLTAFLPTFVVRNENLRFTKSEAAFLSSAFWMSYTVSRLLATILSFKWSPGKIMVFFHAIYMAATIALLAFVNSSRIAVWIGSILVAFGLSPFFGNVTIWGVQYILLTHKYMSVLMVCVCVGAMAPSSLIGQVIDTQPMVMIWSHTGLATALSVCAGILLMYGKSRLLSEFEQKKRDKKNTEMIVANASSI